MRSKRHALAAACLAALLPVFAGGCTMAPKYTQPSPVLPGDWTSGAGAKATPGVKAQDWRQIIADEPTKRLVELALINNRDLRVAALKIEKAQAQYQIQRADLLPKIDATGGANMQRTPAKLSGTGVAVTSRTYSVGLGFSSFELDLFGRIQSLKDEALENFLATEASRRSVELSLVAEVATAYLTLAADREQLTLAQEILDTELASYDIVQQRFNFGVANELDLSQAQTTVDTAKVNVATYTAKVTSDENTLSVLVGMPLSAELLPAKSLADVAPLNPVPAGLPSEVLTRRPDVLAAEHQLKAANADIGAARAKYFPSIGITSSVGFASNEVRDLFNSPAGAWSFVPQLTVPIFHAGAIRAGVKASEAERDIMVAQYEKTVQTAFKEVSDALAQSASLETQVSAQSSLVKATGKSYELSTLRYENGVDSYLSKLDSQRSFASSRQNLISARLSRLANTLTLYKALGGGWDSEQAQAAEKAAEEKKLAQAK
ncbi:MAG TPA: efflux transporter outer membrane subunit [Humidesulfovibrio sp.]|uniref:efflux transporter outer membrane subunit n=1 Tax=Humidesulfovibrio sp. TaxID=2910988 RepID=UPI002BFE7B04|nr:efflux transporter outer membrane subunit [Humidesulfovibrio sp.]HWR04410.1 efflux transporter outer membrane subunit [Humidesulfovibrio sp.]